MRPIKTVIPAIMLTMLLASCARPDQGEPEIIEDETYQDTLDAMEEATDAMGEVTDEASDHQEARPDPGNPELPDGPVE